MAEKETEKPQAETAVKEAVKPSPVRKPPQLLPQYKVLLHNDDVNEFGYVIGTIVELTPLDEQQAKTRVKEADESGVSLLLITHKERAELYQEQFTSKQLTVTIEPAE